MPDDLQTHIVQVREDPLLNRVGGVTARYRISYLIGEHGPYTITMPVEGFTADKAKAEIEKAAAPIRALLSA